MYYSSSATALFALSSLVTTTINVEASKGMRRVGGERKGLRKLNGDGHMVSDVQTECEFVITGSPKVCVKVCVAVTSTTGEDGVIEEYSQVSQDMCAQGWEKDGGWNGDSKKPNRDDIDGWESFPKSWKCTPEPVPMWSSTIKGVGVENSKSSKGLKGKGSKNSKGSKSGSVAETLTVHDSAWDAPAPKPVPAVWSGGARRLSGGKNSIDRMLVWGATPEAEEWIAAPVAPAKSWSSPTPKKKAWAAAPAWSSPSSWMKSTAPTICAPATSSPSTCQERMWYYSGGFCTNGYDEDGSYTSVLLCCEAEQQGNECKFKDVCSMPAPSPPAERLTLSPTTCLKRMWYYSGGICTNGYDEDGSYTSLQSCCEAGQQDNECEFEDVCCMMRKWYFADGICTNGIAPVGEEFLSSKECCNNAQAGMDCKLEDVCVPDESPTPAPTVISTEKVTLSPTTCLKRMWYYSGGICTNGYDEDGSYTSLQSCCEAEQQGNECEFEDVCCMMRKWYFADGICTNGIAPVGEEFLSSKECCNNAQAGMDCKLEDVCVPDESPTPAPTVISTEKVTLSPTTCQERMWYYSGGICTNGYDEDGSYTSLQSCCEAEQQDNECEFEDVCCMMRKWYFADGMCTNGYSPEGEEFASLVECCEDKQAGEKDCTFDDVCVPDEPPTPAPTVIFTPSPSVIFTPSPTFGSTPTVSKEVTGPPTQTRGF